MSGRALRGRPPELSSHQAALRTRLEAHVGVLTSHRGEHNMHRYSALVRAAQYIEDTFAKAGYRPTSQTFEVEGQPVRNIEVEIAGGSLSHHVVVGAHSDSVRGSSGANDNGTGAAALLAQARMLESVRLRRHKLRWTFVSVYDR